MRPALLSRAGYWGVQIRVRDLRLIDLFALQPTLSTMIQHFEGQVVSLLPSFIRFIYGSLSEAPSCWHIFQPGFGIFVTPGPSYPEFSAKLGYVSLQESSSHDKLLLTFLYCFAFSRRMLSRFITIMLGPQH